MSRFISVVARGDSMWPACRDGDVLLVKPGAPPRVGDVVLVRHRDRLVAHRVLSVGGGVVRCRGDAAGVDPPLPLAALVGRVVAIQRGKGLLPVAPRQRVLSGLLGLRRALVGRLTRVVAARRAS